MRESHNGAAVGLGVWSQASRQPPLRFELQRKRVKVLRRGHLSVRRYGYDSIFDKVHHWGRES